MKKNILIMIAVMSVAAIGLHAKNFQVPTNLPTGEYVQFKPSSSNLCLGPQKNSNGSKLVLMSCSNSSTKWKLSKVSGKRGNYRIHSYYGGYLGVKKIKKNGAKLIKSSNARQVKFLAKNQNTYFVKFANRGHVWDVSKGKSRSIGANVLQYKYHGGKNQQWKIYRVNDRRYFNYKSSGNNEGSSSGTSMKLQNSLNETAIEPYFAKCAYEQLRKENKYKENFLASHLNDKSMAKKINILTSLIDGVKRNPDYRVRAVTYKYLLDVNMRGGNFLEKALKGSLKKKAKKALRRENNSIAKRFLKQFIGNIR